METIYDVFQSFPMMVFVHFHLVGAVYRRIFSVRPLRHFSHIIFKSLGRQSVGPMRRTQLRLIPPICPVGLHSPSSTHVCPNASISSSNKNALIDSSISFCSLTNSRANSKSSVFCSVGPPKDWSILPSCSFTNAPLYSGILSWNSRNRTACDSNSPHVIAKFINSSASVKEFTIVSNTAAEIFSMSLFWILQWESRKGNVARSYILSTPNRGWHVTYDNLKPDWFIKIAIRVVTWSINLVLVFYTQSDCFFKIATRVITWSRHLIDARVSQDWFIKVAIPVRTSHVWRSKISFVKGLSPFVNTTIDKINPFVRLSDIVAA